MSGPVIPNPIPAWLRPENASVLDSPLERAIKILAGVIGADDAQSQILALLNPAELQGRWFKGMYPRDYTKEVGDIAGPLIDPSNIQRQSPFPTFGGELSELHGIRGFFAKDPEVAGRFVNKRGAVYPVGLAGKRVKVIDANGRLAGDVQFGRSGKEFQDAVASGNYDAVVIKNTSDEGDIAVALRGSEISSAIK